MLQYASAVALACLALSSCSGGHEGRLSTILITMDTTRRDAIDCYGETSSVTPRLDELAQEGLVYESAYTVTPLTLPAHASMLTGLYPLRHTVRDNDYWTVPSTAETLAEKAQEAGIQTAAFLASAVLSPRFGLAQGFEHYSGASAAELNEIGADERGSTMYRRRPAQAVVDDVLAWLERRDERRPFFLWVHFFDPHAPYRAPEPFASRFENPYHGEIAFTDHQIGRLLDHMQDEGLLARSLVMVTSDHGEAFGEKNEYSHGLNCYQSTLQVPMILRYPDGHRAGERSEEIVSVVDVFPTLADAMGLSYEKGLDGISLYRTGVPEDRGVYFESYMGYLSCGYSQVTGWLDSRGKYIHTSEPALYSLAEDPDELNNLLDERPEDVERYRTRIAELAEKSVLHVDSTEGANEERLRVLQSLGYVSTGGSSQGTVHPLEDTGRPSPQSQAEAYNRMLLAMAAVENRQFEQALPVFQGIVRETPDHVIALFYLRICLLGLNRKVEAIETLQRLCELRPKNAQVHMDLAGCLWQARRIDESIAAAERAVALKPESEEYLDTLITVLRQAGRDEQASTYQEKLEKLRGR